ncbi:hypothetical protein MNB_SV-12-1134 [hydrothermal vent metagenome]|uniref:Tyrosine specific protein phosphatases domain-containing protein n=1 Tax=hydrothermal vent metagenome TaxID=652676 RepID=A0A1W1BWF2_9ZZZZ
MRHLKRFILLLLFLGLFYVSYGLVYGNFHKLDNNAYRSAQLFSFNMPYYLKEYKIKTVLNLRGEKPKQEWYQDEKKITQEHNVTLITYKISARKYLDFNHTSTIVKILKDAKKPILIHCEGGADRTSLVSALYRYALLHHSKEEAEEELGVIYGHLPSIRPKVIAMEKSFYNYIEKSKTHHLSPDK